MKRFWGEVAILVGVVAAVLFMVSPSGAETMPRKEWTLEEFAHFTEWVEAGHPGSRDVRFSFDRETFDERLLTLAHDHHLQTMKRMKEFQKEMDAAIGEAQAELKKADEDLKALDLKTEKQKTPEEKLKSVLKPKSGK